MLNNAPEGYENLGMAMVYANIGIFYRDITTNITEASDKGQYKPLYENLLELTNSVAKDENESEIVRLELLELARSAIQQYATKFKLDEVTEEQLKELYESVGETTSSIETTADKTAEMKASILSNLPDTDSAIISAYATSRGENE